jgi:hypothetical protein
MHQTGVGESAVWLGVIAETMGRRRRRASQRQSQYPLTVLEQSCATAIPGARLAVGTTRRRAATASIAYQPTIGARQIAEMGPANSLRHAIRHQAYTKPAVAKRRHTPKWQSTPMNARVAHRKSLMLRHARPQHRLWATLTGEQSDKVSRRRLAFRRPMKMAKCFSTQTGLDQPLPIGLLCVCRHQVCGSRFIQIPCATRAATPRSMMIHPKQL